MTDTGRGIADGDIERIFDPFFSTKLLGRGLGLPVVLGIVRVLTSGYDEDQVLAEPHRDRPQAFLAKPFLVQPLAEAIARALASEKR